MRGRKPQERAECIRLRIEERLSYKEIAALVGVSKSSVSIWLKDYPVSDAETLAKLSRKGIKFPTRPQRMHLRGSESKYHAMMPLTTLSKSQKGSLAEAAVRYRLRLWGFEVYQSVSDGAKIDFVVRRHDAVGFIKVQVKMVREQRSGLPAIPVTCSNGRRKLRRYTANECDVIVGYDYFSDTAYVHRFSAVRSQHMVAISPESAEKWDLLFNSFGV